MDRIGFGTSVVRWLRVLSSILACAIFAGLAFFALLGLWGLTVAPFVTMRSSSFVIMVALASSAVLTIAAYKAWYRRFSPRR